MINKATIDLHMHTTASDGAETPKEIVHKAKQRGLQIMSITDHDTVAGLSIAEKEAEKVGIQFIPGIELSVSYSHPLYKDGKKNVELHLLGYRFDYHNADLAAVNDENKKHREWRAREIVNKVNIELQKDGKPVITDTELLNLEKSVEGSIGRPHLSNLLIKKNIVQTKSEAFEKYLVACDVPKKELTLEHASELIRKAGGLVVLAHPAGETNSSLVKLSGKNADLETIITDLLPYLDGIECYYRLHSQETTDFFTGIARSRNLIITGGSDHHGGEQDILGRIYIPEYVKECFMSA